MRQFDMIAAATLERGIGLKNALPFRLPKELAYFRKMTLGSTLVLGRKTFQAMGRKALPGRQCVVVTSQPKESAPEGVSFTRLEGLADSVGEGPVFVAGGGQLYQSLLDHPGLRHVYLTRVNKKQECDVLFPVVDHFATDYVSQTQADQICTWDVVRHTRPGYQGPKGKLPPFPTHPELDYLQLVRRVIQEGEDRSDRTGVGTKSIFGGQLRFDLQKSFPLLTTKNVFWRGVVEQLLWFMRGSTNCKELSQKGVKIWDPHGSKQFLRKSGLPYEQGDLGPVYGFQWRHFGAYYKGWDKDYTSLGVDQLKQLVDKLKEQPSSRRHILTAWNPTDIGRMALPPCHMFCQFYVSNNKLLSCQLYQRSGDLGLGVPFNIASYALLTKIVARLAGLQAGQLIHILGDAHVYKNHIEALKTQLGRTPLPFPRVEVAACTLDSLSSGDIRLHDYSSHPKLPMQMAV